MRHVLANVFTYTLALLLVLGSLAFAWIRSAQLVVSDEETVLGCFEGEPEPAAAWEALGRRSYEANCRRCHGAEGQGWDQYPPLVGLGPVLATPTGREYLIALHLWGLASDRWRAPMPAMGHLRDVEVAAVINHVLRSFGNAPPDGAAPIEAGEVEATRSRRMSAHAVDRLRP